MDTVQIPRQMMEINKAAVDSAINAMMLLQNKTEEYTAGFVDKATWLPDPGKKAINELVKSYKVGFENIKTATDENFKLMAGFLDMAQKSFAKRMEDLDEDAEGSDMSSSRRRNAR
jgi:hypothetical protein